MYENTIKDYIINSVVESTKYINSYRYEIAIVMDENTVVPAHLKQVGGVIMLVLRSDVRSNAEFEFNSGFLSWDTSFNGSPFTVRIPSSSIVTIVDTVSEQGFQFVLNPHQQVPSTPQSVPKTQQVSSTPQSVSKTQQVSKTPQSVPKTQQVPSTPQSRQGRRYKNTNLYVINGDKK